MQLILSKKDLVKGAEKPYTLFSFKVSSDTFHKADKVTYVDEEGIESVLKNRPDDTDVLRDKLLHASPKEIENLVDIELRHKSGSRPFMYLEHWLKVGRCFGYATKDDSWGEFERIFAQIVKRLLIAERK